MDTGPPSSWTTTFRECRRQGPAGQADRPRVSVRQTPLLGLGEASRALQPPGAQYHRLYPTLPARPGCTRALTLDGGDR